MCGIAGLISSKAHSSESQEKAILERSLARLKHRGPDGSGVWKKDLENFRVWLGHNRLSIIDVQGGAQPMPTVSGFCRVTYNGELFNFGDLKKELENQGVDFKTRSDTEVLAAYFERNGITGLTNLNGMFAFAIWDERSKTLTLARDRCGIKPLYYSELEDGTLIFASELSGILVHPFYENKKKKLSADGLSSFFFSDYIHSPFSIFDGIKKLEPGHVIQWQGGKLSDSASFVTQVLGESQSVEKKGHTPEALWSQLGDAVKRQLVSDVPVGVFLSGGIDSSSIAYWAAKHSGEQIQTFSIGFEDPTYDESQYAKMVAQSIGSKHFEKRFTERELLDSFNRAIDALDEPLADPSLLPTYLLAEMASKNVKVALGGDGSDEILAGYPTYWAHDLAKYYGVLPGWLKSRMAGWFGKFSVKDHYQSLEWKLKRFAGRWDDQALRRHLLWMSSLDLTDLSQAIPTFEGFPPTFNVANSLVRGPHAKPSLETFLELDYRTYLPGSVLTKVDRASMAHSLEVRPPFLDNEFVAFTRSLPGDLKLKGRLGKYLLRRAAQSYLPELISRRKKKGFGIPLSSFIRGPLSETLEHRLSDTSLWNQLNETTFRRWFAEHMDKKEDRSRPLWAFLVLDQWIKKEGFHV